MIDIQRYNELGTFKNNWLNAHYHFSFSGYHNPNRMGLGALRVINDDIVKAHSGFEMHPHRDMEIITYVRKGAITHRDSLGNEGKTAAGDVQVMSAGTGIVHAEHNVEDEDTNLYQIWIQPKEKGIAPDWDAAKFPKTPGDTLSLLVSGRAEDKDADALYIHADARIWGGIVKQGTELTQKLRGEGYLLVSSGEVTLNGETLGKGDGAAITDIDTVMLKAVQESEVLLIEL